MSAYAVAHLRSANMNADLVAYLTNIDATLTPYQGRFIVHGAAPEVLEGVWEGDLIVIEFPDLDNARQWYRSANYQWILPLRLANSSGEVLLIDGVSASHRATDILESAGPAPRDGLEARGGPVLEALTGGSGDRCSS